MPNTSRPKRSARVRLVLAAFALSLGLPAAARAGTLLTPPIFVPTAFQISCQIMNAGAKPAREVVVQVLRIESPGPGTVEAATTPAEVAPLAYTSTGVNNAATGEIYACRFTFKGNAKTMRGSSLLRDPVAILDVQEAR
jgi:hypothetical protein